MAYKDKRRQMANQKRWCLANPEKVKAYGKTRRTKDREATPPYIGLPQLGADGIAEVRLRRFCGEPLKSIERAMGRPVRYYAYGGLTRAERIAADPTYYARHRDSHRASAKRRDTPEFRAQRAERYRLYHAARRRVKVLKKNWGLTPEQYDAMLDAQGDACAICSGQNGRMNPRRLAVDHNHATDAIRGLLCDRCNRAIGWFFDEPEILRRAADYLEAT